jgi:O-antigen/teichoic acid export membrane protein
MSRFKRFAHSLASGYVLLGATTVYTLASAPLALMYLSKPEFALWALASSIAQYVGLIDMGMLGTSRILIDYKDRRDDGNYGSVIQTFVIVSLVQGFLILLAGIGLPYLLTPLLRIQAAQRHEFIALVIGQCALLGGSFVTRIFQLVLGAHQRYDVINYSKTGIFAISLGILWVALANDQGVYSTLWAQAICWVLDSAIAFAWTVKLKVLPAKGHWGRPAWDRFRELFRFGGEVFLTALGFQMLSTSQTLILTRILGLETAATWKICTQAYLLVSQLIYRIFEYSAPALAEMIVRGEKMLLCARFKSLVVLSGSLALWSGTIFWTCNQPFVQFWMGGKFGWPVINDLLLAIWLVVQVIARCHLALVGQTKKFGLLRFLYLLEGTFFVSLSLLALRGGGPAHMIAISIVGNLLFSFTYGTWRTSRYFNLPWRIVWLDWSLPTMRFALWLLPIGTALYWTVKTLPPEAQFAICALSLGMAGIPLFLRVGLDATSRAELMQRLPARVRSILRSVAGGNALVTPPQS